MTADIHLRKPPRPVHIEARQIATVPQRTANRHKSATSSSLCTSQKFPMKLPIRIKSAYRRTRLRASARSDQHDSQRNGGDPDQTQDANGFTNEQIAPGRGQHHAERNEGIGLRNRNLGQCH